MAERVPTTTHVALLNAIFNNLQTVSEGEEKACCPQEPTGLSK
jgi:hypothetical protein